MKIDIDGKEHTLCTHQSQPRHFKTADSLVKEALNCGLESVTFQLVSDEPVEVAAKKLMKSAKLKAFHEPGTEMVVHLSEFDYRL